LMLLFAHRKNPSLTGVNSARNQTQKTWRIR
jgi:hypothetical protein